MVQPSLELRPRVAAVGVERAQERAQAEHGRHQRHLAVNDRNGWAGIAPRSLPALHVESMMDARQGAVPLPTAEVVVQGVARRQVLPGPPPQPSLPAVRRAMFAHLRQPKPRISRCCKKIASEIMSTQQSNV